MKKKRNEEQREKHKEYMKLYHETHTVNKIAHNRSNRKYRELHPEKTKEWVENNREYYLNQRKEFRLRQRDTRQTLDGRYVAMVRNCKELDRVSYPGTITISYHEIVNIYQKQNGKCFYLGIDMLPEEGIFQMSVDRLDSNIGHSNENCVLTILPINRMKSNMTVDAFYDLLAKIKESSGIDSHSALKYSDLTSSAKLKIRTLLTNLRRRDNTNSLTLEEFNDLRIAQNDICQLTGVPITWEPKKWNTGSIDRIDSTKGYIQDNIQITMWVINNMKGDMPNEEALQLVNYLL